MVHDQRTNIFVLSPGFYKLCLSRLLKTLMTEKFRNRYRIQTTRLKGYDYTRNGAYFITICTKKMIPYFGGILSGRMNLSETGIVVHDFWLEIPCHYSNTQLDEFIVMPDHIHGIIILTSISEPKPRSVNVKSGNQNWKSNSIGSIINQFKRICTIKTKSCGLDLLWQPRFYDHIIRTDNELNRIRTYIKNNPDNWINDDPNDSSNNM